MNELPFIKMHGAGNDYVFIDGFETRLPDNPSELSVAISHRGFGVGSDGLVLLIPPTDDSSDVEMRMWNADGSEGSMCGNAARCVALWMNVNRRLGDTCRVRTVSRMVNVTAVDSGRDRLRDRLHGRFRVDHGSPRFDVDCDERTELLADVCVPELSQLDQLKFVALSMGNPHAVFVVDQLTDLLVRQVGAIVERHVRFKDGTNVEWVRVLSRREIELRVWERGSGETLACGSGACAAVAACVLQGRCDRNVDILVDMPGGQLSVCWADSGELLLTGPAEVSFQGVWRGRASVSLKM